MLEDQGRLRWMCRRGMLELDVLFERFIDNGGYARLDVAGRHLFETMLQEPDPVLYSWLLGYERPQELYKELVSQIRGSK